MARRYESTGYNIAIILYSVSFLLPATISRGDWWWGWQVAMVSLVPPGLLIAGPSNIGFVVAALRFRAGAFGSATVAALIAVSFMIFCGITAPSSPGGGPLRFPGGGLGAGYYLWMLSGVMSLYSAIGALVNARGLTAKREVYWRKP